MAKLPLIKIIAAHVRFIIRWNSNTRVDFRSL